MRTRIDLTNQKFGQLTAIEYQSKAFWKCQCSCGAVTRALSTNLIRGRVKSCGCSRKSEFKRERQIYSNMIYRCTNPNNAKYKNYGGRGIGICEQWLESFENFINDMGVCPKNYSLDRINNDGNYEISNCRWATKNEQARNTSRTRFFNGKCLTDWAKDLGVTKQCVYARMKKLGTPYL